ncbi:MAG: PH domain-containing protein [Bdellovibrionales bacterium]
MSEPTKAGRNKRSHVDLDSMLVEGEHIVEQAVITTAIYWKAVAVLIVALVFALGVAIQLGVLLAVVSILMFIFATFKREILFCVLTDKRIFVRYGLLQIDVVDIRFSKIESIEIERMLPGYLMGYANLVVAGTGNRYIVIPYVSNADDIRRAYNRLTLVDEDN